MNEFSCLKDFGEVDLPITESRTQLHSVGGLRVIVFLFCMTITCVSCLNSRPAASEISEDSKLETAHQGYEELMQEGRYLEALFFADTALKSSEAKYGFADPRTAVFASNLARLLELLGRYSEAELHYKRALAIVLKRAGPYSADAAIALANIANVTRQMGRFAVAEALFKKAIDAGRISLKEEPIHFVRIANNLALLYLASGQFEKAEGFYNSIHQFKPNSSNWDATTQSAILANRAGLFVRQGRYRLAEAAYRDALTRQQEHYGPRHPDIATTFANLANVYRLQGLFEKSEFLLVRAIQMHKESLGKQHPSVADDLNALAITYFDQELYNEAESLLDQALSITELSFGAEHLKYAELLHNSAIVKYRLGKLADAEQLQRKAMQIKREIFGEHNYRIAVNLNSLGEIKRATKSIDEAEKFHQRALDLRFRSVGKDHPELAYSHYKLALVYEDSKNWLSALTSIRKASDIWRKRTLAKTIRRTDQELAEYASAKLVFLKHLEILYRVIEEIQSGSKTATAIPSDFLDEVFELVQLTTVSRTGWDAEQMAKRFAIKDQKLSTLFRTRQDIVKALDHLDLQHLLASTSIGTNVTAKNLRFDYQAQVKKLDSLDKEIRLHPSMESDFLQLRQRRWEDVRRILKDDEVLLAYVQDRDSMFLWMGRMTGEPALLRLPVGKLELDWSITSLRKGLDPTNVLRHGEFPVFDVALAQRLYKILVGPVEDTLGEAEHLIIVPDGSLRSLPFSVLVKQGGMAAPQSIEQYRDVNWIARFHAVSVAPSVASVSALREYAKLSHAENSFIGFGNPNLYGGEGATTRFRMADLYSNEGLANVDLLRSMSALPDTESELVALATLLDAPNDAVYMGEKATESNVRSMELDHYRTIAFATHGLLAWQSAAFEGEFEPALVLTPPDVGSNEDDGLLTASEIANLVLDADWAILSACNTAASDGSVGANGFSGLARAFFYAGARSLLVSHWPVASDAAAKLTTGVFSELAENPTVGRAEALRRSMLALMANSERSYFAHPSIWAPFSIVGEGRGYQ